MSDLNLTPMNEGTARALFAEQYAERFVNAQVGYTPEQYAELRIKVREGAKEAWHAGTVPHETLIEYRELALAATLNNWQDVARQAWDKAIAHAVNTNLLGSLAREALLAENPYTPKDS